MWKSGFWNGKFRGILFGVLAAYIVTLLGVLILAYGLFQWDFSASTIEIGILVLYSLSCLIGGMISGKKAASRKFLWGMLMGLVYFFIVLFVSWIGETEISIGFMDVFLPGIICLFSGMLGGMLV